MAEISKISWTDGTLNFWEGCRKRSPGCLHCYAENRDLRWHGGQHWGRGAPRKKSKSAIKETARFQKNADEGRFVRCLECGTHRWRSDVCCGSHETSLSRPTFFVMSLGDFFDEEVDPTWRAEALAAMLDAPAVDFMILTKCPELALDQLAIASLKMTPAKRQRVLHWLDGTDIPPNIALGTSIENADVAGPRIDALVEIPAARRFISAEPLLSGGWAHRLKSWSSQIHLVIAGGESGAAARPMHPAWAAELEERCDRFGIPFHFKQWGEWVPEGVKPRDNTAPRIGNVVQVARGGGVHHPDEPAPAGSVHVWRAGVKVAGRALDRLGRTRTERLVFPMARWRTDWVKLTGHPLGDRYFPSLKDYREFSAANPASEADIRIETPRS